MIKERHVYSGWAFSDDRAKKSKANREHYEEIKDLAEVELLVVGYAHHRYRVVSNPHNLTTDQLALIADKGNLCFGYRTEGDKILVHTD